LSLISRHLEKRPVLEINTPFSTERQSTEQDDIPYNPLTRTPPKDIKEAKKSKMSNQPEHPALLIPGPIEFDDDVLQSMSHYRYGTFHNTLGYTHN
jgi:alanine-glyoxylate transaminase/serine-glyoxylate transaminase/serine-pyruvate transaminase